MKLTFALSFIPPFTKKGSFMIKKLCLALVLMCSYLNFASAEQFTLSIEVEVPDIKAEPYHRPYIAVWLETPKRKGVHTFAFWAEQEDWYKDLRQWWRKIGRKKSPQYDAVTGATRKPGRYQLSWQGQLSTGQQLPAGDYVLHFESVREQGSREYLRQKVSLATGEKQQYHLSGNTELGQITIAIH